MTVAEPRFGSLLPNIITKPPGRLSKDFIKRLREVESHNVTHIGSGWPIFWERAYGSNVQDVDGNIYLDLSSAFGVALIGHTNPRVVQALKVQGEQILHGMGDIHPPAKKVELLERL